MNHLSGHKEQENYEKAKQDILQAIHSINKLTVQQKEQLATELLGINATIAIGIMR